MVASVLPLLLALANPMEARLLAPGGFEKHSPLQAMLIASGVTTPDELRWYEARANALIQRAVKAARARGADENHFPEVLLWELHRAGLTAYDDSRTDLRHTLKTGRYQCVTSTALYVLAAREAGLNASAYGMKAHVMPLVFLADGVRYLESTNPKATATRRFMIPEDSRPPDMPEEVWQALGESGDLFPEQTAARAAEMKASAFDADPRVLTSFFFWNHFLMAAREGDTPSALAAYQGVAVLGAYSPQWARTLPLRLRPVAVMLAHQGVTEGWPRALKTVDLLLQAATDARERLALRDVRARLFVSWAADRKDPQAQCRALADALKVDPDHITLKYLAERHCGAQP